MNNIRVRDPIDYGKAPAGCVISAIDVGHGEATRYTLIWHGFKKSVIVSEGPMYLRDTETELRIFSLLYLRFWRFLGGA